MAEQATTDTGRSAKAPTKAALVDAGLHLMLEKGYHHTGIQDVLQAAGVPKGSFYYYFPSKEAFGLEVIAQFAAAYVARLEQYLGDTTQSPLTRLRCHLDETLARLQKERGFGVLMFSHELRHAYGRTQQIYVMSEGKIVESGHRSALQGSTHSAVRRLLDRRSSR